MRETILTIILILLLAATGALWFFYRPAAPGAAGPSQAGKVELARYRAVQGISPDTNLFADPGFRALRRAREVPAVPPPPLPRNPFQPL